LDRWGGELVEMVDEWNDMTTAGGDRDLEHSEKQMVNMTATGDVYTRRMMTQSLVSVQISLSDMSLQPVHDTWDITRESANIDHCEVDILRTKLFTSDLRSCLHAPRCRATS
jgi:hypothetical protein